MPVKMTREQYNTLYGVQPVFSSVSSLDTTPAPVRMTQSEYDALYRPKEATLLEKTGSVLKGETTSPAKLGGAETILPNITSYFKNIPSSAANLIRQTIAPINPLDTENPLNIGAALVRTKEAYKNDLQSGTPIAEAQKNIILSPLKGAFSMWKGAGESIYKNLEQNALASKTLSGGVALSAAAATSKIAEMIINDPTLVPALLWAPEAVGAKADAISKTARPFIEAGTAGARAFEPVVARASKLAEPVVSKLPKVGLPAVTAEARLENTISKIEQELFKIENNYSTTRKANDFVSDAGAASRRRIASTDVLVGAVDNNGILRTKGAGSAIEKYRAQTIDGIESVVRDNLFREGKTANIAEFGNKLKLAVYDSGLEGSDLVKALDGIKRELQGLALRADEFGNLPLYRYHDAKIATTNGINYLSDSKPTVFYRKAKARAYKEFVEEKSTFNVKAVNQQLKKYYEDIALLERLDGKRVEGGRLGKYFASISGNIIGGATGAAVGGYAGAAVGSVLGGEAAQLIKGGIMSRTFGKARGLVAPENSILAEAKQTAKLKPSVDLRVPDKAVGALKNVPKTKEILSIEKKIKDNVRQQLAAIKAGDFTLVAALKEIYTALVDKLKKEIKIAQSYSLGSRKTQYSAKAATSKKLIESNVASKTEKVNETDFLKREAAYSKMEQKQFEANSKIIDEYISMTDAQKTAFENALTEGEIDKLKMESAIIEEVIANSPEKELQKYATVTMVDGKPAKAQLPEVGRSATDANGKYRLNGDEIANNLGYEDTKAAQDALERFVLVQRRRDNINDMLKKQREVKKTMKNDTATQDLPQDSRAALGLSTQDRGAFGRGADEVFNGYKDLTTKVLGHLEGKSTVSKQFISDLTNRPELKQPERDLIREVLSEFDDKVPVQEFADKVKARLLPLEPSHLKDGRYENISLGTELRGDVADYTERIYSSPIKTSAGDVHYSGDYPNANYFAHSRIEDMADNSTRRVIEVQSDLFQKGRLAAENRPAENAARAGIDFQNTTDKKVFDELAQARDAELNQLQPYRNTWWERIIREEVRTAAKDGKTKLQFPTGETAMKIEGLGQQDAFSLVREYQGESQVAGRLTPENIKVGQTVAQGNQMTSTDWIITEVLDDGKFRAVPKNISRDVMPKIPKEEFVDPKYGSAVQRSTDYSNLSPESQKMVREALDEQFDISGKVDTSNPIYRFYEKDVQKYLRNKYNAKVVTDKQGVQWVEFDVPKDAARAPIEAFGIIPIGFAADALLNDE